MILSHIVAVAANNVIGINNDLPWEIPEDMKFFRDKTKGKALVMGRKTFESVGHPLPHRLNVVVTRKSDYAVPASDNVVIRPDLKSAIDYCSKQVAKYGEEIFIIGGGEIFRESMGIVDVIYLTRIHQDFTGDITYPEIDERIFELVEKRDRQEPIPFSFLTYIRRLK